MKPPCPRRLPTAPGSLPPSLPRSPAAFAEQRKASLRDTLFASSKLVAFLARQLTSRPELMADLADLLECGQRTLALSIVPQVGGCRWGCMGVCGGGGLRVSTDARRAPARSHSCSPSLQSLRHPRPHPLAPAPRPYPSLWLTTTWLAWSSWRSRQVYSLPPCVSVRCVLHGRGAAHARLLASPPPQAGMALPRLMHDFGHCVVARELFQGSTSFDAYISVLEAVTGQVSVPARAGGVRSGRRPAGRCSQPLSQAGKRAPAAARPLPH